MNERQSEKRIVLNRNVPPLDRSVRDPGHVCRYIYLLSPANASGRRARMLLNPRATFDVAMRLRTAGISLGEAFSFMSSLYFRGKLAYSTTFLQRAGDVPGSLIITPSRGLLSPEIIVSLAELTEIVGEQILAHNPKYRDPLERDLRALAEAIGQRFHVVLLGSIATRKYVPLLLGILGDRLLVPRAFVGMGNMQRGALLLRCSREKCELEYISARLALDRKA